MNKNSYKTSMKRVGLLGGMSWQSTAVYYSQINQLIAARLGGLHCADLLIDNIDFEPIQALQHAGHWTEISQILIQRSQALQKAGAQAIVIATNTMHQVADEIQAAVSIPLLHIADATGRVLANKNLSRPLLLGTEFTMQGHFYRERLEDKYAQQVCTPNLQQQADVHRIIYDELCIGQFNIESKKRYLEIIQHNRAAVDSLILGCTEIGLLIKQEDCTLPFVDTVDAHSQMIVDWMLSDC
jgi:aspartate racemase